MSTLLAQARIYGLECETMYLQNRLAEDLTQSMRVEIITRLQDIRMETKELKEIVDAEYGVQ